MTKILFLLAPSEGKNEGGKYSDEKLSFSFEKPLEIASNVTEKDLKCSGNRYIQGLELNQNVEKGKMLESIKRYSGVVFNAINYEGMNEGGKVFFQDNVLILSGMYGLVKPLDVIGNYKLPIETKGLYKFWGDKILDRLNKINPDYIVNLLPNSYLKMINSKKINAKIININFLTSKDGTIVKISHNVKKHRGEFLRYICENNLTNYEQFQGKIVKNEETIDINILK